MVAFNSRTGIVGQHEDYGGLSGHERRNQRADGASGQEKETGEVILVILDIHVQHFESVRHTR